VCNSHTALEVKRSSLRLSRWMQCWNFRKAGYRVGHQGFEAAYRRMLKEEEIRRLTITWGMSRGSWVAGLVLIHGGEEMRCCRRNARPAAVASTNTSVGRSNRSKRVAQRRPNSRLHSKYLQIFNVMYLFCVTEDKTVMEIENVLKTWNCKKNSSVTHSIYVTRNSSGDEIAKRDLMI